VAPLDRIPPYLMEVLREVDPERLRWFVRTGKGLDQDYVEALRELLARWLDDDDFWGSFEQAVGDARGEAVQVLDAFIDEELVVVTDALEDDDLANAVLLEAPAQTRAERPDPYQVRPVVIVIQQQVQVLRITPDRRGAGGCA
jgi:hypothetical protein